MDSKSYYKGVHGFKSLMILDILKHVQNSDHSPTETFLSFKIFISDKKHEINIQNIQ